MNQSAEWKQVGQTGHPLSFLAQSAPIRVQLETPK
jgi:hypothetical protein